MNFLDFVLKDDFIFPFNIDLFVIFKKSWLILSLKTVQLIIDIPQLVLIVRNTNLITVDSVESTLKDINSIIKNFSKGTHSGLPTTVSFSLTPYLLNDGRIEVPS